MFFFQAEDGIRDLVRSRGLGDVYKRQREGRKGCAARRGDETAAREAAGQRAENGRHGSSYCLLYTSDAADDLLCVDLGGRRIIKKNK